MRSKEKNIVVSFGGFLFVLWMVAAKLMSIPLLIHEPNSVVGQANKLFLGGAAAIAYSFKNTIGIEGRKGGRPAGREHAQGYQKFSGREQS